jgi:hypothetical protein
MSDWKYASSCWNCHKRVEGGVQDVQSRRDYYDEHYFALICPDCGAHTTIPNSSIPNGYWWDDDKKCLRNT